MDLDDFGAGKNTNFEGSEDYDVFYIGDLDIGDTFTGEIFMSDIRFNEKLEKDAFTVVITNHDNEEKHVFSYISPTMVEEGTKLYGRKGSKAYELIDSILSGMFNTKRNDVKYHSVVFEQFREGVNSKIYLLRGKL